ncbi:MAG: class I SAM-dependent methyltransferase, partial [Anaerolineaceae bacterium]|nr:class I SAM-dependent methyltransferase [Anaerolineaceae bacterium]
YDRFVNWQDRLDFEMPLIKKQLTLMSIKVGRPLYILDSACGTGMHAIEIVKQGHHVFGADLFPEMVKKAKSNATGAGVSVDFRTAGFGKLTKTFSNQTFDIILCLGNSLPHILSVEELSQAIQDFHACLNKGGILIIQNRNYDNLMVTRNRWMEPQAHKDGETEWLFQRFYDFETDGMIRFNIITLKRQINENWQINIASTHLRPQSQNELIQILQTEGFDHIDFLGSMTASPFDPENSPNLIIIAKLPDS